MIGPSRQGRLGAIRMAGKIKAAECGAVLPQLVAVNEALGFLLEKLNDSQKVMKKSIQCQEFLNQSLQPIVTAFKPQEGLSHTPVNPVE